MWENVGKEIENRAETTPRSLGVFTNLRSSPQLLKAVQPNSKHHAKVLKKQEKV